MDHTTEQNYVLSKGINTDGGPLIALPSVLLNQWFGSFDSPTPREARFRFSHPNAPATDYDRACDVDAYLGLLSMGEGTGLVLGDEPVDTYIATSDDRHTMIVRPILGNDDDVRHAISHSFGGDFKERIDSYTPFSPEHILFNSASLGEEVLGNAIEGFVTFELPARIYSIDTYVYQPNEDVYVVTHHFIPTLS